MTAIFRGTFFQVNMMVRTGTITDKVSYQKERIVKEENSVREQGKRTRYEKPKIVEKHRPMDKTVKFTEVKAYGYGVNNYLIHLLAGYVPTFEKGNITMSDKPGPKMTDISKEELEFVNNLEIEFYEKETYLTLSYSKNREQLVREQGQWGSRYNKYDRKIIDENITDGIVKIGQIMLSENNPFLKDKNIREKFMNDVTLRMKEYMVNFANQIETIPMAFQKLLTKTKNNGFEIALMILMRLRRINDTIEHDEFTEAMMNITSMNTIGTIVACEKEFTKTKRVNALLNKYKDEAFKYVEHKRIVDGKSKVIQIFTNLTNTGRTEWIFINKYNGVASLYTYTPKERMQNRVSTSETTTVLK